MRSSILAALLMVTPAAWAQQNSDDGTGEPPRPLPSIGIDRLLSPGSGSRLALERTPGGKDRETWLREFSEARAEVAELESRVAATQDEMRNLSRGNWSYAPAGGGQPENPEILKRKAQIKRDRQSLEAAGKRLRELEVEASLAGVPASWIQPPEETLP
ncbi:MAG: hypothetical protein J4G09_04755 [Proteobacteria bacterium]|nr:hypothetical protein [Pseudomonadota bacterium]